MNLSKMMSSIINTVLCLLLVVQACSAFFETPVRSLISVSYWQYYVFRKVPVKAAMIVEDSVDTNVLEPTSSLLVLENKDFSQWPVHVSIDPIYFVISEVRFNFYCFHLQLHLCRLSARR